jgi:hypothetical protein
MMQSTDPEDIIMQHFSQPISTAHNTQPVTGAQSRLWPSEDAHRLAATAIQIYKLWG